MSFQNTQQITEGEKAANLADWTGTPIGKARLTQTVRDLREQGLTVSAIASKLRLSEFAVRERAGGEQ